MAMFLCKLWPYLFGGLIGWFSCGIVARQLKYAQRPIQQIVANKKAPANTTEIEKRVEVTKEVEVDNPAHLVRIAELEAKLSKSESALPALQNEINNLQQQLATSSEKHVNRVSEIRSNSNDSLSDASLSFLAAETNNSTAESSGSTDTRHKDSQKSTTHYLSDTINMNTTDKPESSTSLINIAAAKASGFKIKNDSDFTIIEGIGPKINQLLHEANIASYRQLSNTSAGAIQEILTNAGSRFSLAKPGSWPKQASYAANNEWSGLKKLQDELDGGV